MNQPSLKHDNYTNHLKINIINLLSKNPIKVKKLSKKYLLLGLAAIVILIQGFFIAKLFSEKDHKNYQVNLVKISTEKDSIDYFRMKNDLEQIDRTVRQLNSFLTSKNISNDRISALKNDSLSNAVYLAEQANRYSQKLVDLQRKLQLTPLGHPTSGTISSNFGIRKNPIPPNKQILLASLKTSKKASAKDTVASAAVAKAEEPAPMQFHKGIDYAVPSGSDVLCTAKGKVIFAGVKGGYGNCVIISHGNGLSTLYAHLSKIEVNTNDNVEVGEVIAKSGNTGRSTGPHLHYEVHKNNQPINPKLFLNL